MALSRIQVKMIRRLFQSGTDANIAHAIEKIHPSDLSILFSELSPTETQRLINSLFLVAKAGGTIRELPEFMIPDILEMIDDKRLSAMMARLEPDDALFLLEKVPESRRDKVLSDFPPQQRQKLDRLLLYPRNSAGSVMTSSFVTVKSDMTVEEAIESLRHQPEAEGIFYIYVADETNRLIGVQSLRNLVMSQSGTKVKDIMNHDVYSVSAMADQEEAAQIAAQYGLLAVPVVNDAHEILGVITIDDVIDIVKEEATEDIYHMAGLSQADRAATPLGVKVKKRLPWMIINLLTATLAASVVGFFQDSIEKVVALAVFMPIVAGMGGNGATQSLTVIARSIALGELGFVKAYKAIFRETGNGIVLGIVCGLIIGTAGWLWKGNPWLGIVLFFAMMLNLLMGGLVGAVVPITFNRLRLDPAVGTSVVVTMFTDVCGFLFFLGLATLMLKYLV